MQLATIGYEGAALADFIATLVAVGIERVVDVRAVAQSRRLGFSKCALRAALAQAGLDYFHVRQLGDPKHGREAARAGDVELFRTIFNAHMDLPASRDALTEAILLTSERKSVLVCFERDARNCHRTIVAQRMAELSYFEIINLSVQSEGLQGTRYDAGSSDRFAGAC